MAYDGHQRTLLAPFYPFWDCCLDKTPFILSSTLFLSYCRVRAMIDSPLFVSALGCGRALVDLVRIRGTLSFGPLTSFATWHGLSKCLRKAYWEVEKCWLPRAVWSSGDEATRRRPRIKSILPGLSHQRGTAFARQIAWILARVSRLCRWRLWGQEGISGIPKRLIDRVYFIEPGFPCIAPSQQGDGCLGHAS